MSVIDEVKQKLDIVDIVGQYVQLKKAGRNFKASCPFHSERTPSFFVFPERQTWHCFGACGTGGDAFSFIMRKEGVEFGEALRLLARQAGVTIPSRFDRDTRKDEKERIYQANQAAARFFHDLLLSSPEAARARDYLQRRGFRTETVSAFKLGFARNAWEALKQHLTERGFTDGELIAAGLLVEMDDGRTRDRFRNRLIFPIHDSAGRVTGFGARVLDDSLPKYTNSPQTLVFDKSGTLYGIDLAADSIRRQDQAVLVEGYMDVITAHQNGFRNVVASMGTSVTERQVAILKRLTRNIALALDADTAGEEAMLRCVDHENTLGTEVRVISLPSGSDPDDAIRESAETWRRLVAEAVPVIDFAITTRTTGLDLATAGDKSRAAHELLPMIARVKDPVRRDHYLSRLAISAGIRYNSLEAALKEYIASARPGKPRKWPIRTPQRLHSHPREEYCLSLLLQHPGLKDTGEALLPEYFRDSQNREVLLAWRQAADLPTLQEKLDPALWEHVESLLSRKLPADRIQESFRQCVLLLREMSLRDREEAKAAALAQAAETAGSGADLARLKEEGIETSTQLKEVFELKARTSMEHRKRWR
jgi:DNA primase